MTFVMYFNLALAALNFATGSIGLGFVGLAAAAFAGHQSVLEARRSARFARFARK